MTSLHALTLFHTALSLVALGLGVPAILALFGPRKQMWTTLFLVTAIATSATGFLFPFNGLTPPVIIGIIALATLALMLAARYVFAYRGAWRRVYAIGLVLNVYFLAFVTVVQLFLKVPSLTALAPTQGEPPFAITQLIVLALFVVIGIRAINRFHHTA